MRHSVKYVHPEKQTYLGAKLQSHFWPHKIPESRTKLIMSINWFLKVKLNILHHKIACDSNFYWCFFLGNANDRGGVDFSCARKCKLKALDQLKNRPTWSTAGTSLEWFKQRGILINVHYLIFIVNGFSYLFTESKDETKHWRNSGSTKSKALQDGTLL